MHLLPSRAVYVIYVWKGKNLMVVRSISSIFASSDTFLRVYSKVISVSAVTFPTSLVSKERSSERLIGFSFLNYKPLWS
jgi:hypothetical protein